MRIESGERGGPVFLRLPLPAGRGRGALPLPRRQRRRGDGARFRRSTFRLSSRLWGGRPAASTTPASGTATSRAATSCCASARDRRPAALYLVDLNRTRMGRPPGASERLRDLSRLALFRPEHQELLLRRATGGDAAAGLRRGLYLAYHRGFLWKNDIEEGAARLARPGRSGCCCRAARTPTSPRRRRAPARATRWSGTTSRTSPTSTPAGSTSCGSAWPTPRSHAVEAAPPSPPPCRGSGGGTASCSAELHRGAGRLRGARRLRPPLAGESRRRCSP